jgi:uncharacterized protein (TIGR02996 family)
MQTEDLSWLETTAANPEDVALRLVFADWLEDRDDPRGSFIRVQTELAALPAGAAGREQLARRAEHLCHPACDAYRRVVPPDIAAYYNPVVRGAFAGGLLRKITLFADRVEAFREHASVLFRYAPVDQIAFEPRGIPTFSGGQWVFATTTEGVNRFLQVPLLARLGSLVLYGPFEDLDAVVGLVLNCPALAGLRRLEFDERRDERDVDFRRQVMSEGNRVSLRHRFGDRVVLQ